MDVEGFRRRHLDCPSDHSLGDLTASHSVTCREHSMAINARRRERPNLVGRDRWNRGRGQVRHDVDCVVRTFCLAFG